MHYGDEEQLKAQKLIVTVYKSEWTNQDESNYTRSFTFSVKSIVEAHHVSTHSICQLHYNIEHIMQEHIPKMEADIFYLVELMNDGFDWNLVKMEKLTTEMLDKNPLLGLH